MDWAVQALLAGWESAALNVLAGLEKPPNEFDVERYVERMFDDLGVEAPEMPHLATLYAIAIAQDMLAGTVTPHTGAKRLYRLWAATGCGRELQVWCGLDDQCELARDQIHGDVAEVEREILDEAARMVGSSAMPPGATSGPDVAAVPWGPIGSVASRAATTIGRWTVLLTAIALAVVHLNSAAYSAWAAGVPATTFRDAWMQRALTHLCYAGAATLGGLALFRTIRRPPRMDRAAFILAVLALVLVSAPRVRRLVLADRCLDIGRRWDDAATRSQSR